MSKVGFNVVRPYSSSSSTDSWGSLESGAKWVLKNESKRNHYGDDISIVSTNSLKPTDSIDNKRPASRDGARSRSYGELQRIAQDQYLKDSIHPHLGKSPYLQPVSSVVSLKKSHNKPRVNTPAVDATRSRKFMPTLANTTSSGNLRNKTLCNKPSSSDSLRNTAASLDEPTPSGFKGVVTEEELTEADHLYDIMCTNKLELIRYAMDTCRDKGLLSVNSPHPEWIKYFDYHLKNAIENDSGRMLPEYNALHDQLLYDSRKLVSDRVSGVGRRFMESSYFPGRPNSLLAVQHLGSPGKQSGLGSAEVPISTLVQFPLEEFAVVCPEEIKLLATFKKPPVEVWMTLKVMFYIFFAYHTHLELERHEFEKGNNIEYREASNRKNSFSNASFNLGDVEKPAPQSLEVPTEDVPLLLDPSNSVIKKLRESLNCGSLEDAAAAMDVARNPKPLSVHKRIRPRSTSWLQEDDDVYTLRDKCRDVLQLPTSNCDICSDVDMEFYWDEFGNVKNACLDVPKTPALAMKQSLAASLKLLSTGQDMATRAYAKVLAETVDRKHFYKKSGLTLLREGETKERAAADEAIYNKTHLLSDSSVEFSWEEFRLFILKHPAAFCQSLSQVLEDKTFIAKFPEALINELRSLVGSCLFSPTSLINLKNNATVKLCLWSRRVIALIYDQHLTAARNNNPNVVDSAGSEQTLQPSKSGLFHMHNISVTSTKDRIKGVVKYHVPTQYNSWHASEVNKQASKSDTRTKNVDSKKISLKYVVGVLAAPMKVDDATPPVPVVNPTKASYLAFIVTMSLVRPLDCIQLVCSRNSNSTRDERKARLSYLEYLYRENENRIPKFDRFGTRIVEGPIERLEYLKNVKTREDLELFEKGKLKEYFDQEFLKYAHYNGGMPTPTYASVVIEPKRVKKTKLNKFPYISKEIFSNPSLILPPYVDSASASSLDDNNAFASNDSLADNGSLNTAALEDSLGLSFFKNEAVEYATYRPATFVVLGYEGSENMLQKCKKRGSRHSLVENCNGWVHQNAILRYANTSIVFAKSHAVQLDMPVRYVVGVNESASSRYALQLAARLAKPCDVITVFHVVDPYRLYITPEEVRAAFALDGVDAAVDNAAIRASHNDPHEIPHVTPGSPSYVTNVFARKSAYKVRELQYAAALARSRRIVATYKRYGYNVSVIDDSANDPDDFDDIQEDPLHPPHPVVRIGSKIATVAADMNPTFLILGSGNYSTGTLRKYYDQGKSIVTPENVVKVDEALACIDSVDERFGIPRDVGENTIFSLFSKQYNSFSVDDNVLLTVTETVIDHPSTNFSVIAARKR